MLLAQRPGQSIQSLGLLNYQQLGRQMQLGSLSGTPEVAALQQALVGLAQATGRPQINPGQIDGTVGAQTVQAVIAGTDLMSEHLPTWAFLSLKAGMIGASMVGGAGGAAASTITTLAAPLTIAANTAAVKFRQNPTMGMFGAAWWTSPTGLLVIAGLAFVGYKLFLDTPAKPAAAKAA